ncbi:sensor domain-containing diguanylate cyclase [Caldanaerobius polysaccharolyticus]|uniref:sensor domain-containing diguanylate cyclase n=1 Tax=Caldanaerobius polysaccharolyticus TaxID=44256 RepID=UPI00068FB3A3|nr:sensor domain-containing diguanylate cyclase [Caldanaerobius polysaccharolyticus]
MVNKLMGNGMTYVGYIFLIYLLFVNGINGIDYWVFAIFIASFLIVEYLGIRGERNQVSLGSAFVMVVFLVYGVAPALLMASLGMFIYHSVSSKNVFSGLSYGSRAVIAYGLAAWAFYLTGAQIGPFYSDQVRGIAVFVVVSYLVSDVLRFAAYRVSGQYVQLSHVFENALLKALFAVVSAVCAVMLAYIYREMNFFYKALALLAVLLLAYNFHILSSLMYANKKLKALYDMLSIINSRLDVNQVGEAIIDAISNVVNFSGVAIFLGKGESELEIVAWDMGEVEHCDTKVATDKEFVQTLLRIDEPAIIDCCNDKDSLLCSYFNFKSCMIVPLVQNIKTIGAILLFHDYQNAFSKENLDIVTMISRQGAIALYNAKLYREMTQKSITDPITKLYNRRYFTDIIKDIVEICQREDLNVSLIMIDIDYFKRVNDTYGHLIGDEVIKELASRIKMCTRGDDIVARYGGEEFVVVLPSLDEQQAYTIAERIRKEIAARPFTTSAGELHVTVSAGICEYPAKADSLERLIANADRALYMAKARGRNKVIIYEEI